MNFARLSEAINQSINNANKIPALRFREKHLTRKAEKTIEAHLNSIISTDKFQSYQNKLYADFFVYGQAIIQDLDIRDMIKGALNDPSRV